MFTNEPVWTVENLHAFHALFVGNPLTGNEEFQEKLRKQLKGAPPQVVILAAEAVWVLMLFPSARAMRGDTKARLIRGILGIAESIVVDGMLVRVALEWFDSGVGHPGRAYIQRPDRELEYLLDVVIRLKRSSLAELVTREPWGLAQYLESVPGGDRRSLRHVLLNLLYPNFFEGIISAEHRKNIIAAFQDRLKDYREDPSDTALMRIDRQILHIRKALEAERRHSVDFYDADIQATWKPSTQERPSPPRSQVLADAHVEQGQTQSSVPGGGNPAFKVDADALNVRVRPGNDHPLVGGSPLPRGTVVEQLEAAGAWRRIVARGSVNGISGVTGWVSEAALEPSVPADEVSAGTTPPEPPATAVDAAVPGLVHDHVGAGLLNLEHDRLGIAPEVRALCHVLVAETSRPPISVGLFGDWGTGKSFFMELMHDYIRTLTGESRRAVDNGEESAFCTDVVQIRFNAWHYMDSNLWASLAARIFDGLAAHMAVAEPDKRAELALRLAESEGVLAQMRVERTAAEEEASRRREEFRVLNRRRRAARRRLGRSVGDALIAGVRNAARDPALQKSLRSAEKQLGLPADTLTPESVERHRDELRTRAGRVAEVWKGLGSGRRILLLACVLLPIGLGMVVGMQWDAISRWGGGLIGAVVALAPMRTMLAPRLAAMKRAFLYLEQANQVIERQTDVEEQKLRDAEIADQREVRRLEAEARTALRAEGDAQKVAEQIRTEMEELRSGRQLQRFLQERGAADDYRRHLGIVSLIRNDFERLSELLRGLENEGPQPGMPNVDRIILYIDDLDRCPESRVVEVLQAVHLLLAFPLFVVVVGVDSRWLLLSLEDHYTALRGREGGSRRISTPQNYLEKIFQIPFTLRPMQPDGFGKLMGSLVTVRGAAAATDHLTTDRGVPLVTRGDGEPSNLVTLSAAEHGPLARMGDDFDEPQPGAPGHGIDLTPPALELESWEADFMCALHPLIGSPRSAKRFVNVYHFIRARLSGDDLDRFRGSASGGDYQIAALLLAALVGFPRESRPVFRRLMMPGGSSEGWWKLVEHGTLVSEPAAEGADGLIRFARAMEAVRSQCTFADLVAPFRVWAPVITRFSFNPAYAAVEE